MSENGLGHRKVADLDAERQSSEESLPESDSAQKAPVRTLLSTEILQGDQEVLIRHGEDCYRLRLTRNGKLILQK